MPRRTGPLGPGLFGRRTRPQSSERLPGGQVGCFCLLNWGQTRRTPAPPGPLHISSTAISPKKILPYLPCLGACFLRDPHYHTVLLSSPFLLSPGRAFVKGRDTDHGTQPSFLVLPSVLPPLHHPGPLDSSGFSINPTAFAWKV